MPESVADWALNQLVNADLLEVDSKDSSIDADRRLYKLTILGKRMLKDRRARLGPIRSED